MGYHKQQLIEREGDWADVTEWLRDEQEVADADATMPRLESGDLPNADPRQPMPHPRGDEATGIQRQGQTTPRPPA